MSYSKSVVSNSRNINIVLISLAAAILIFTMWYSNILVKKIKNDERINVRNWAMSIQRQDEMLNSARTFFAKFEIEERKYANIWSFVHERLLSNTNPHEFDFLIEIVSRNKTIPFIVVDDKNVIVQSQNQNIQSNTPFEGKIKEEYTINDPIPIYISNNTFYLYYKASKLFEEVIELLDNLTTIFNTEILKTPLSVPIIITDRSKKNIINYSGVANDVFYSEKEKLNTLKRMAKQNKPIEMHSLDHNHEMLYVFYENSTLITTLKYLPIAMFCSLLLIIISLISVQNFARRIEQDQVWLGMSKETAHQLGTPLSSLIAWLDFFKSQDNPILSNDIIVELEKDVKKFETVVNRFSKIGSVPDLTTENIVTLTYKVVQYLEHRTSNKIKYHIAPNNTSVILANINIFLFEWVIENICKNAVNAIGNNAGNIHISIIENNKNIVIDISDDGCGISKKILSKVFDPGFTTQKRGWGLGLSLCKRIIKDYHKGKVFVLSTVVDMGTTFRIILKRNSNY